MKLKKGITIHNQLIEGCNTIFINSGTQLHSNRIADFVDFNQLKYIPQFEENAYTVINDWRSINNREKIILKPNGKYNDYSTVYLGSISDLLKEKFEKLELQNFKNNNEIIQRLKDEPIKANELSLAVNVFLLEFTNNQPFSYRCISTNNPNIETVSFDTINLPQNYKPNDIKHMGLHNDSAEKMTIHTAYKYGNRISINIGKDSRCFFFTNLTIIQAFNMLKNKINIKEANINIANISKYFFQYFPDYPVIKVILEPYKYYVAPTDNCFHDGSTLGNSNLDISIIYSGSFSL